MPKSRDYETYKALADALSLADAYEISPEEFAQAHQTATALAARLPLPKLFDEPSHVFPAAGSIYAALGGSREDGEGRNDD